ncbi:MAG: DPP IV N-terminal domain-containing protein [Panacagrimonas sp.]
MFNAVSKAVRHTVLGVLVPLALLSACSDDDDPQRLPDVSWLEGTIAFVCEYGDGDNDELCLMNADGSKVRRITDNPGPDRAPTWNAEGTQLAFNSRRDPHADRPQIYRYDVASGEIRRLTNGELEDQRASWTPDGEAVVFQRGNFTIGYELFLQSVAGGPPQQLTDNPGRINAAGSYAPDGSALALQSNRDETGLFPFSTYVVDTASSNVTRLATEIAESHDGPRWSPSGDRIAFSAGGDLYVITVATGAVTTVTDDDFSDSSPAWSPDGRMLVFQSDRFDEDLTTIHVIDLETREIGDLGEGRTPVWSPIEF